YATIVSHQENHYPGRPSGTRMVNPDFATWMRAFDGAASVGAGMSGHGERVETTEDFAPRSTGLWPRTGRRSSTCSSILRPCRRPPTRRPDCDRGRDSLLHPHRCGTSVRGTSLERTFHDRLPDQC